MIRNPAGRGAILLAAACAVATTVLFAVAVRTAAGQRLDWDGRGHAPLRAAPRVEDAVERLVGTVGVASLSVAAIVLVGVALARRRPDLALAAGIAVVGANLTTQVAKATLERPDLVGQGRTEAGAFPSGHVTAAMSVALALVLVAPPARRGAAALAGGASATAVGVGVLALDHHRPSEVLAGLLVPAAWTATVLAVLQATGRESAARPPGGRWRALLAGAAVLALGAVAAVAATRRLDLLDGARDRTSFVVAAAVVALVCAALAAATVVALDRPAGGPGPPAAR